jgi:dTDP-4-amino-4,6-dideoxygalactose transaminase
MDTSKRIPWMARIMRKNRPFEEPVYITRPLLPDLERFCEKLKDIWGTKWLTNHGVQHNLLEIKLRDLLKVPCLSLFNNGTIALIVACRSLRLSGDVITTPFTFPATPHVLTWNNIRPVFCDIDPVTMNIDPNLIASRMTPQTTGILAVHVFGTPCDVAGIQEIADHYDLKVIYDAAHAFGVEIEGGGIGNFGDISMFSFHATKLFHTAEGGALAFKDPNLKGQSDLLKNFGIKNEEEVVMPGINGKMNEIQAALGLIVLDYIDEERKKRESLAETYRKCLKDIEGITTSENEGRVTGNCHYCVIRIDGARFGKDRDYVYEKFKEYNVFTRKYFYPLCSDYAYYRQLPSSASVDLPIAHRVVREVLSLPLYGALTCNDVERICDLLKSFRERNQ